MGACGINGLSLNRYNPKRDSNEPEIAQAFRNLGCSVTALSGKGVPDLLVEINRQWVLVEVKSPKGKLTPPQKAFFATATAPCYVATSLDDVTRIYTAVS